MSGEVGMCGSTQWYTSVISLSGFIYLLCRCLSPVKDGEETHLSIPIIQKDVAVALLGIALLNHMFCTQSGYNQVRVIMNEIAKAIHIYISYNFSLWIGTVRQIISTGVYTVPLVTFLERILTLYVSYGYRDIIDTTEWYKINGNLCFPYPLNSSIRILIYSSDLLGATLSSPATVSISHNKNFEFHSSGVVGNCLSLYLLPFSSTMKGTHRLLYV